MKGFIFCVLLYIVLAVMGCSNIILNISAFFIMISATNLFGRISSTWKVFSVLACEWLLFTILFTHAPNEFIHSNQIFSILKWATALSFLIASFNSMFLKNN